jgi:hypothetical protein
MAAVATVVAEAEEGPALGDEIVQLQRAMNQLQAVQLRKLRRFDREGGPAAEGARSTTSWLRYRGNMAGSSAAARVAAARMLPELEETRAAFEAGDITFGHVSVITKCARDVGLEQFAEGERILTQMAREADPKAVAYAARYLRSVVDPDGFLEEWRHNQERRRLHMSQMPNGMFHMEGVLDAESGVTVQTALDALMKPRGTEDHRTGPQRRADALTEVARMALDSGNLPSSHGQKPHLVIYANNEELSGLVELAGAGPIPREVALRLTCDAAVTIDGQRAKRTASPALRRARERLDRHCFVEGCDAPPSMLEVHHIKHWADGGETTVANTVLVCRLHHGKLFHDGFPRYKDPP